MPAFQQPKHLTGNKSNGIVVSEHLLLHGRRSRTKRKGGFRSGVSDDLVTPSDLEPRELKSPDTEIGDSISHEFNRASDKGGDTATTNKVLIKPTIPRLLKRASTLYSSYDQTRYLEASKIFTALQHQPRDDGSYESAQRRKAYKNLDKAIPYIQFESDSERKLAYELAYSTLKYQYVLEDLLEDIAFYAKHPELVADSSLVDVIFSDYMQRKFLTRELHPGEITYPEVTEVEECITDSKVKLDAALARRRIKECARSVEDLLPASVKAKEQISNQLLTYAWVNFHKTSMNYVTSELRSSGYRLLVDDSRPVSGSCYCVDTLFEDTLVFSPEQALNLSSHRLVQEGCLVIQDRTSLFGPQSTLSLLNSPGEDVLVIDYNSGATAAHLSSLLKYSKKSGHIYLFGIRSTEHKAEVQATMDRLDASYVKVIDETFDMVEHDDIRLRNVKITLILGQCSKTAVLNPVSFVITEGEDVSILQDLSLGKPPTERVRDMTRRNLAYFKHAINMPKVQAVVFVTRSTVETENEKIVQKAIESHNTDENRKHPYRVVPPLLKFDSIMAENEGRDKYYRLKPSEQTNGCFVAVVTKEVENVKEGHQAILQRAVATGLLNEGDDQPANGDKQTKTKAKKSKSKNKNKNNKSSATSSSSKRRIRKPSPSKRIIAFGSSSASSILGQSLLSTR